MTLEGMQELHPTATIEQIKNNRLFLVKYPRLTLAVSYKTLIAFCFYDEWHICTEKNSKTTTKHQYHLLDLLKIKYWHPVRSDFLQALKVVLNESIN